MIKYIIMKIIDKTNNNLEKIENCIDLAEKTDMIVYSKRQVNLHLNFR